MKLLNWLYSIPKWLWAESINVFFLHNSCSNKLIRIFVRFSDECNFGRLKKKFSPVKKSVEPLLGSSYEKWIVPLMKCYANAVTLARPNMSCSERFVLLMYWLPFITFHKQSYSLFPTTGEWVSASVCSSVCFCSIFVVAFQRDNSPKSVYHQLGLFHTNSNILQFLKMPSNWIHFFSNPFFF